MMKKHALYALCSFRMGINIFGLTVVKIFAIIHIALKNGFYTRKSVAFADKKSMKYTFKYIMI